MLWIGVGVVGLIAGGSCYQFLLLPWPWPLLPIILGILGLTAMAGGIYQYRKKTDQINFLAKEVCYEGEEPVQKNEKKLLNPHRVDFMSTENQTIQAKTNQDRESKTDSISKVAINEAYRCFLAGDLDQAAKQFLTISKKETGNNKLFSLIWLNHLNTYPSHQFSQIFCKQELITLIEAENLEKWQDLQKDPQDHHVLRFLGIAHLYGIKTQQNVANAIFFFDEALKQHANDIFSLEHRAKAYASPKLKQFLRAIQDIEKAIILSQSTEQEVRYRNYRRKYIIKLESQQKSKKISALKFKLTTVRKSEIGFALDLRDYPMTSSDLQEITEIINTQDKLTALYLDDKNLKPRQVNQLLNKFQKHLLELKEISPQQLRAINWNKLTEDQTTQVLHKIKDWIELDLSDINLCGDAALFRTKNFPVFKNLTSLKLNNNPSILRTYKTENENGGREAIASLLASGNFPVLQELDMSHCKQHDNDLGAFLYPKILPISMRTLKLADNDFYFCGTIEHILNGQQKKPKSTITVDLSCNIIPENLKKHLNVFLNSDEKKAKTAEDSPLILVSRPSEVVSLIPRPSEITKARKLSASQWLVYISCHPDIWNQHLWFVVEGLSEQGCRIIEEYNIIQENHTPEASVFKNTFVPEIIRPVFNTADNKFALVAKISAETGRAILSDEQLKTEQKVKYRLLESVHVSISSLFGSFFYQRQPRTHENCVTWVVRILDKYGIKIPYSPIPSRVVQLAQEQERLGRVPIIYAPTASKVSEEKQSIQAPAETIPTGSNSNYSQESTISPSLPLPVSEEESQHPSFLI